LSPIVARYGTQAWRYLGWTDRGLARIERWKAKAAACGMSTAEVEALWAQVELAQMLGATPFSALVEADRRLVAWMAR